jgi:hypothetical protein
MPGILSKKNNSLTGLTETVNGLRFDEAQLLPQMVLTVGFRFGFLD